MTLALLLTAVTGAWAQEEVLLTTINASSDFTSGSKTFDGVATVTITGNIACDEMSNMCWSAVYGSSGGSVTVEPAEGTTISSCKFYFDNNGTYTISTAPFVLYPIMLNGSSFQIYTGPNFTGEQLYGSEGIKKIEVYGTAEAPINVEPGSSANTWTFSMPGSDVVLTPIYAKAAAFATTGTEPEVKTLLPEAAEGVIAGTDASLIAEGTGIVAFAGESTDATQGTLMYAIGTSATEAPALTDFSATVPTAQNVADDGADVLVWYYIQGADAPQGEAATLDNTFSDTEPACLTVQVLTNKFDIQFNAANANTIEAGKATVTVGGTAATVTDGKLQGVKMGSEVKLEAKPGYKFRKVEVKKGAEAPAITLDNTMTAWTAGKYAVPAGGLTYSAAITVSGNVTLVLTDGETLTLNKGISLAEGATLTIEGNGTMNVNGTNESTASTVAGSGTLVLTSGTLNAKGGNGQSLTITEDSWKWDGNTGASGGVAINGNVTVSGGTVTATGGNGGNLNTSAIGFSENNHGGNGGAAISGSVTVNAGGWTATNGSNGTYIGGDDSGCYAGTGGKAVAGTVTDNR